jgi:hypothetical protein
MAEGLRFARASLPIDGGGVRPRADPGCMTVTIDLDAMARSLDDEASAMRVGEAIYGSFDPWLWRPDPWPRGLVGELRVEAPSDIAVSLPHLREGRAPAVYMVPFSTWSFMSRMAIGRLDLDAVVVSGARLSIARLPGTAPLASTAGVRRFLEGAASAVATVDGRMPVTDAQVLLRSGRKHDGRPSDAVQFGTAMRGGGPSVALRLSSSATDDELYGEWIATHELAHLWLPPVDREGAWLSEGLASYYQCVLRSRVGMYTEARAWDELTAGFARGRAQASSLPLRDARRPRFQQIYWGGAAILFKIDVDLRRRGLSLDAVIAAVRRAPRNEDPARMDDVSASEMLGELESVSGTDIRSSVSRWLDAPFPDVAGELDALGIRPSGTDGVTLDDEAPLAAVRRAIAARR